MRVLVAGIGNIFMGDDAFGCEVVRSLGGRELPGEVDVVDFGIRGIDLGYALTDDYTAAVLIDTAQRGGEPGTLYVIEPGIGAADDAAGESGEHPVAPHEMDPVKVLRFAASIGALPPRVLLVACEPAYLGGADGHMGLSEAVAAAVERAATEVRTIVDRLSADSAANRTEKQRATA